MFAKYLVPAAAVLGAVAGQQCTQSTATINSPADATNLATCQTFKGSIVVSSSAAGNVDFTGISQITGDLIASGAGGLTGLSSSTLNAIGGAFSLSNLTGLSTLSFSSLSRVGSISWTSLNRLPSLTFGTPGIIQAKTIVIADTFLSSLTGIDVTSASDININNNRFLTQWTSSLANLSNVLNIQANGLNFGVSLNNLAWIANMTIANVTSFNVPALQTVNGSARFDSNYFTSFNAPNLTSTVSGDISFVGHPSLTNITMPQLTSINGGLLIANNTALEKVNGFQKLKTVGGTVKLRGSFNEVDFPALNSVVGTFDASSTGDISSSCDTLKSLSKTGGKGQIQGAFNCTSNNAQANQDTNSTTGTTGGTSGSSSGNGNSAAGVALNTALFGLALVGGLAAML